jgi:hypothetical protein
MSFNMILIILAPVSNGCRGYRSIRGGKRQAVYACPISRDAGFPVKVAGRPPQFGLDEATSRFTPVTACRFASPH